MTVAPTCSSCSYSIGNSGRSSSTTARRAAAWELAGRPQRIGQRQLNLNRLRKLNLEVEAGERLPETRSLADIEWPDG